MTQPREHTLTLSTPPDTLDSVHELLETVWGKSPEIAKDDQMRFETALIELASNIFRHADSGSGISCTLHIEITSGQIKAQMRDTGEPGEIQLTGLAMPDHLSENGRGLVMIQALVDELTYERDGEHNVWRITRKLSQ
jgi:serine/threonine-protein kinase RsbW